MYYIVYLDVLFLVNFLMDFFILWLMKSVLKYRATNWQLFLGAATGALWLCLIVAFPVLPKFLEHLLTYVVISGGMIFVAFRKKSIRELIWGILYLYLFAVFLGGVCNVLYYHTQVGTVNQWLLMVSFSMLVCYLVVREIYYDRRDILAIYQVTLYYQGEKLVLQGLFDSGNSLSEPFSGKPVSIVEHSFIKELIVTIEGCKYIPYQSVGKADGLLLGVEIDQMLIEKGQEQLIISRPVIGICNHSLCENHRYQILLHPSLFEDGVKEE